MLFLMINAVNEGSNDCRKLCLYFFFCNVAIFISRMNQLRKHLILYLLLKRYTEVTTMVMRTIATWKFKLFSPGKYVQSVLSALLELLNQERQNRKQFKN